MSDLKTALGKESREALDASKLFGVIVPLMTPFTTDLSGRVVVDTEDLAHEVRLVLPFVHGLFPCGNAGEGSEMNFENWSKTVGTVIETRDMHTLMGIPVFAGVLRKNPHEIQSFAQVAQKLGSDAIIVAPMFGGNPQKALDFALHSTNLPIVLYNNPSMHNGEELPLSFIQKTRDEVDGRVIGIKSSTKDMAYFEEILKLKTNKFKVFQGDTGLAAKSLEIGADGIVPAQSSINPSLFWNLFNSRENNYLETPGTYSQEIVTMLDQIKSMKSELNLNTAQIIKNMLVKQGVFKSPRMYKG